MSKIIYQNKIFEWFFQRVLNTQNKSKYSSFKQLEDINTWSAPFLKYFDDIEKELEESIFTPKYEELKSLKKEYTFYAGWGYKQVNDFLRKITDRYSEDRVRKNIEHFNKEFKKFKTPEDLIAIRLINKRYFTNKLKKNSIYIEPGYSSLSLDTSFRKNENSDDHLLSNKIVLLVKIPKETPVLYFPSSISNRNEYEILLNKNTSFFIEKKHIIGSITFIVTTVVY